MKLDEVLPAFKDLELKMSEAYLWCAVSFEGDDLRKFFSEMSDQEQSHAKALDSLSNKLSAENQQLEIPPDLPGRIRLEVSGAFASLKQTHDLEQALAILAELEQGELNTVFESIMRAMPPEARADFLELTTKRHIQFFKDGCARFLPGSPVLAKLGEILVKDRSYYRVFNG